MLSRFSMISLFYVGWLAGSAAAAPAARSFDIVTFTPPEGSTVDARADRVTLTLGDQAKGRYLIIGIYKAQPASGDLAADYRKEWSELVEQPMQGGAAPDPTVTKLHEGLTAAAGSAAATRGDQRLVATLFVLDGGPQVASVVVLTPDADSLNGYAKVLGAFFAGVTVTRPVAKTITLADLVGDWSQGDGSTTDYVNGSGAYVGSQTNVYAIHYSIQPDGSYTYTFGGMLNGKYVKSEGSGVVSIEDGLIVFREKKHNEKRYHFIDWQETPDGPVMTILDAQYEPHQGNMIYREVWHHRKPGKKK